jgi:hypothetical protein
MKNAQQLSSLTDLTPLNNAETVKGGFFFLKSIGHCGNNHNYGNHHSHNNHGSSHGCDNKPKTSSCGGNQASSVY